MQLEEHKASGKALAAAARRRRKTFASREEARSRLRSRMHFADFTEASLAAHLQHDMVECTGAQPAATQHDQGVRMDDMPSITASQVACSSKDIA